MVLIGEVGDFTRFSNPRRLTAYFGLVAAEQLRGETVWLGGITKGRQHPCTARAGRGRLGA
ncbi:hypothetical protein X769_32900 [Mesorhizobium sp. LSJC268A00]|uniref:transposase n=1 Tax=Mesorhizobium sp. C268A TaxID=2956826 RepID=UPI0003CF610C|nr:hypothetical protein X769_32900 [Mesorhizobium sp. LSJC268A00]